SNFDGHGGSGSITYNASRWIGLTGEVGTYDLARGAMISYLFGPRLNLRKFDYFVPFAEFLAGGVRGNGQITGAAVQDAFALAAGGGVDMVLTKNVAWRVAQLDYVLTSLTGPALTATGRQNSFRAGTGLVLRFGIPNPPPPPNHPPVAACSVSPSSVFAGSGDSVAAHVNASDPDNDPLTYSYTTTGGQIVGSGSNVQFDATGLKPGTYTLKCTVNDGRGGTADASGNVGVKQPPEPPQVKQLETKLALHS